MDKLATFYSAFEIESRSTDTIFRELCNPADYKKLDEGNWKERFVNRYGQMMADAPNMRKIAAKVINERLDMFARQEAIDAERTYFVTFTDGYKNAGDQFYRHNMSQLKEAYSLVDVFLFKIFENDWWHNWNELGNDRTNGIYTHGKDGPEWGPSNKLPFSSKVLADVVYNLSDWDIGYTPSLNIFWENYKTLYRDYLADSFLASALIQYRSELLTDEAFSVLRDFYYGKHKAGHKAIILDVYGYYAPDIICIYLNAEYMILYIPGANIPFREFTSMKEMKIWIGEQLKNSENRSAFARHFSLYDRKDGGTYYGVNSVLRFMAEGNKNWPVEKYIMYKWKEYNLNKGLFAAMCDNIHERTMTDMNERVQYTEGRYCDFIQAFDDFFLAHVRVISMIMPEALIPFNMDTLFTPLGLSTMLEVNPQKFTEPHQCKGTRVNTDLFKALDLLRISTIMAENLKSFSRPENQILPFASEVEAIKLRFGLTEEQQEAVRPGEEPKLPVQGQPTEIRLVRLANDVQQLAVITNYAGNQYKLLDTLTLAQVEGQLVSAVTDEGTGKVYYTTNSYFRGYLPFEPYHYAFESLWTAECFKEWLYPLGNSFADIINEIFNYLKRMHASLTLRKRQKLAFELIQALDTYVAPGYADDMIYKRVFIELRTLITDIFFPTGMELLRETLLTELPIVGFPVAGYIYEAGIDEISGRNVGLTAMLLSYAKQDNIIPLRNSGFKGQLLDLGPYPPLYVVENLKDFNMITTRYFEQEPYKSLNMTDNKSVFFNALDNTRQSGLFRTCMIYDDKLYIGSTYDELVYTVSEALCKEDCAYSVHPLTVVQMLQELSGNAADPGTGLFKNYSMPEYYDLLVERRLQTIKKVYYLCKSFDFSTWNKTFDEKFRQDFDLKENETTEQTNRRQIGLLLGGKGCALPANAEGIKFFLDNLKTFTDMGVTCVGVTSLYGDLIGKEIDAYLTEGAMYHRLNAILLKLDEGLAEGPFRSLLKTVRTKNLSLLPVGVSDGSSTESNGYTQLYFRGATLLNALNQVPAAGKIVFFTHQNMMFPTPGINAPLPGLTQCLQIPGVWVDAQGQLHCITDAFAHTVLSDIEEWQKVNDEILPIVDDNFDSADVLLRLMPESCKLIGLKVFNPHDIATPTFASREDLLKKTVNEADWPALQQDVNAIKQALNEIEMSDNTSGATEGTEVNRQLEILGYQPGEGTTLIWWRRNSGDNFYSPSFHTAPTVRINDCEYVVDMTHLQFTHGAQDEKVIILAIDDWAKEICCRATAHNPYLVYSMKTESELNRFVPLAFLTPQVSK